MTEQQKMNKGINQGERQRIIEQIRTEERQKIKEELLDGFLMEKEIDGLSSDYGLGFGEGFNQSCREHREVVEKLLKE